MIKYFCLYLTLSTVFFLSFMLNETLLYVHMHNTRHLLANILQDKEDFHVEMVRKLNLSNIWYVWMFIWT